MEDNLNERRPEWKTKSMEDDHIGRQPQWKTTSMKDDLNGRQTQWKTNSMEDNLNGRQSQWKMPSRKPYRKQMISACLPSKSCTELGPAQPQLVLFHFCLFVSKFLHSNNIAYPGRVGWRWVFADMKIVGSTHSKQKGRCIQFQIIHTFCTRLWN